MLGQGNKLEAASLVWGLRRRLFRADSSLLVQFARGCPCAFRLTSTMNPE